MRLGQLVRDQHDDSAFAAQVAQQVEKRVQLRRREHAGRLVENQDARIEAERAQHFEADSLGNRTILDRRAGRRQLEPELRGERTRPRRDAPRDPSNSAPVSNPPSARFSSHVIRSNSIGL